MTSVTWSRLSMSEYPSAECKSVNINPCDSRVGKLAVMCDANHFRISIESISLYRFLIYTRLIPAILWLSILLLYYLLSIFYTHPPSSTLLHNLIRTVGHDGKTSKNSATGWGINIKKPVFVT